MFVNKNWKINQSLCNRFTSWPVDALEKVAQFYIEQIDIADVVKEKCVKMCQAFHTSVGDASQRYVFII